MKKTSSLVWRFFDRVEENKRCVAVVCKLCDTQYKYFGNTTNLRSHLVNKHPIQWELLQNGTLDDSTFRSAFDEEDSTNQTISVSPKRRKYSRSYKDNDVRYSVSVDLNDREDKNSENTMPVIEIQRVNVLDNNSDGDLDHVTEEDAINVVHHLENRGSDEEWLNDEIYETIETYEPKRKKMKYKTIKRELQSPQPKVSSYYVRTPTVKYQKPQRVVVDSSPSKDEYSIFGDYIANKLRKLKEPQTRGNVQQLITTILWGAEYGIYDSIETVKRVVLHSVQDMTVHDMNVIQTEQIIVQEEESPQKDMDGNE